MYLLEMRRIHGSGTSWKSARQPAESVSPLPAFSPSAPALAQTQTPDSGSISSLTPPIKDDVANEATGSWTLKKLPAQPYMRELYRQFPDDTPAFFRDSLFQVVARTYYLTRDNSDGTKSQAWTAGGWIAYRSGLIGDIFGVHAAVYTSEKLFAPDDEPGTKLLTPDNQPLNMLGQAYARVQMLDQELRVGRQLIDTPLINPQDNRMVPNTFEGAVVATLPDKERQYDYSAGYLTAVKQRDSNDFISMSDALAGEDIVNRGAPYANIKYRPFSGLTTIVEDYYVQDFVNTGFAQAEYDFKQPKDRPNPILGANVIDQQSMPQDMLTGSAFQTYQASAKVQMAFAGWTAFAAGSATGDNRRSSRRSAPSRTTPICSRFPSTMPARGHSAPASLTIRLRVRRPRPHRAQRRRLGYARLERHQSDERHADRQPQRARSVGAIPAELRAAARLSGRGAIFRPLAGRQYPKPATGARFIVDYTVLFRPPTK